MVRAVCVCAVCAYGAHGVCAYGVRRGRVQYERGVRILCVVVSERAHCCIVAACDRRFEVCCGELFLFAKRAVLA